MIKEIIFFNYGNSKDISNWSNVPFCFTSTLERHGIKVNRIDISPSKRFFWFYDRLLKYFLRPFSKKDPFDYTRSPIFTVYNYFRILKAIINHRNSDYCIFTTYDYYNCFSNIPSLLFCDWTLKIFVEQRERRMPFLSEKLFYIQQKTAINKAKTVISLFPVCAENMKKEYPKANIHYLSSNVINNVTCEIPSKSLIEKKRHKLKILFIGRPYYKDAAQLLANAFIIIRAQRADAELHIIGLTGSDLDIKDHSNVHLYGYLHKDVVKERDIYYSLLKDASIICNPAKEWGGYSSMIEAMYFYTPVIVSPYADFTKEFGEKICFGKYIDDFAPQRLAILISELFTSNSYYDKCVAAHEAVKDYTWDNYVDKLLNLLDGKINTK